MSSTAFLFPGQGSQAVGMAQALAEVFESARDAMAEADEVLGFSLSTLCFTGPQEALTDTINAQPALLASSIATLRAIQEVTPAMAAPAAVAGHSLGEYSALVAAESLSYADALRLVRERGRLMKEAGKRNRGGMAAVLGLDMATMEDVCESARIATDGVVQVANDNCPGQVVVSGDMPSLERAMALAEAAGARKVVRLAVSIAAHSPLMAPAAEALRVAVENTSIDDARIPVVSNVYARPIDQADAIREDLVEQLTSPVLWADSMRTLVESDIDIVIEIGSGDVLSKLMRRIDRSVSRLSVGTPEDIEKLSALST
ncbi:MAG: ACP S-malonyltransferase [Chloroflexota bacterium]|nr:ACP S-malonyltransferase [Chloroflexota bacterium]